MIARFTLALPFYIAVQEGAVFQLPSYEDDGYVITFRPPGRSDRPPHGDVPDAIQVDGSPGFMANALVIDFAREAFNRSRETRIQDPPKELVFRAVDYFISRVRYVTRAPQVQLSPNNTDPWRLKYLNDDGSDPPEDKSLTKAWGQSGFRLSIVAMNPTIWQEIHGLPPDWVPPPWDNLLLDARGALPHIGTSVVLAATSLEVFIASILNSLARVTGFPADVWNWLNDRGDFDKQPSTEEQFDTLLKHFTSHSLKDNNVLWQGFKNLRTARNKFVHEGVAKVGGTAVSSEQAATFVGVAGSIIKEVRGWLPDEIKWPESQAKAILIFEKTLISVPQASSESTAASVNSDVAQPSGSSVDE